MTRRPARLIGALAALLAASCASPTAASADGCGAPIDLSAPGQALHGYPTSVQSGNSCFAFAAALLSDAWRLSHNHAPPGFTPNFVTAGAKLYTDMMADGQASTEGGFPDAALNYIRSHPVCDQMKLFGTHSRVDGASLLHHYREDYDRSVSDASDCRGAVRVLYTQIQAAHPSWTPEHIGLQGMYEFNIRRGWAKFLEDDIEGVSGFIPSGAHSSIEYLAALLARESPDAFIDAYTQKACASASAQSQIPAPVSVFTTDDGQIAHLVNAALDAAAPQPTAVTLCAAVLSEKRPYSGRLPASAPHAGCVKADLYHTGLAAGLTSQEHVLAVIGRRRNPKTQECEWLMRGTWGLECQGMKSTGVPWECQGVSDLWVNRSELAHNVYQVTVLENGR